MLVRGLAVTSLALVAACSLLVSTGDLAREGAAPVLDGASNDESSADGSAPADGDAAQAPPSPCASAHVFCDDFDDGGLDLASRWNDITADKGTLALSSERAVTAPRALRTRVGTGAGRLDTKLVKKVAVTGGTVRVELDVFLEGAEGSFEEVDPVSVTFRPGPFGHERSSIYVIHRPSRSGLLYFARPADGGAGTERIADLALTRGAWHHLTLTYSRDSSRATLSIDENTVYLDVLPGPSITSVEVAVGAPYVANLESTWTIDIDNVVVDNP